MNVGRLSAIVSELMNAEDRLELGSKLAKLTADVTNLVGAPATASYQTAFAGSLDDLASAVKTLDSELLTTTIEALGEINAKDWFTSVFVNRIRLSVSGNALTPAVISAGSGVE